MLRRISKYIAEHSLLTNGGLHLVALSGGADSVCLLLVLRQLGYNVEAVHCNFHLRGDESDRDEHFCRELCEREGVAFHLAHFDTRFYADFHKVSIEMAARELRYRYFEQLRNDLGAESVCVAHHKDDNVETVLMNIIRGTGLTGLIGIRPKNGTIVRPLLCVSRDEIVGYLDGISQPYVVDSTNLVNDVTRNKLRLDIIPLLKVINPSFQDNVVTMTKWLTDVEKITDDAMNKAVNDACTKFVGDACGINVGGVCGNDENGNPCSGSDGRLRIDLASVRNAVSPEYLLFTILHPKGFTPSQIKSVADRIVDENQPMPVGKQWTSASYLLVVERDYLLLAEKQEADDVKMKIPETGKYVFRIGGKEAALKVERKLMDFSLNDFPQEYRSSDVAVLDADKVEFPLVLRNAVQGDRFVPYGMRGSKLISDFMTDRKFDYFQRKQQLVLTGNDGNIAWLVGQRPDARYSLTKDTINIIIVRYINE